MEATKPGWKTTEFWITVVAITAANITAALGLDSLSAAIIAASAAIGYPISRGIAKS